MGRRVLEQKEALYAKTEDLYEDEIEQLESLPTAFEEGTWSQEDVEWILEWKTGVFTKPTLRHFRKNEDAVVQEHIENAVHESNIRTKVESLTSLSGVGVPVASAILLFINPDRFTVIDERAWRVLYETGYLPQELSDDPTVEEYLMYLGACWALANEYDVSLRTLDMALWALDTEESVTDD